MRSPVSSAKRAWMAGERLCAIGLPSTQYRSAVWRMVPHYLALVSSVCSRVNLKRATIAIWSAFLRICASKAPNGPAPRPIGVARALHDFGGQHLAVVVDGDDHRQLAIQLVAALLGEVLGALVFYLAAQRVVIRGVGFFGGGGADVALFGAGFFFVDAFFDLGQQFDELLALGRLVDRRAGLFVALAWIGGGQACQLLAQLGQQLRLLLLQRVHLALRL